MSELRERISNKANDMLSELAHRIEGAKRHESEAFRPNDIPYKRLNEVKERTE